MGKVIAVMNRKGGVGKTTTAIGLADAFVSQCDHRVVVVDLDPQASASMALLGEQCALERAEAGQDLAGYLRAVLTDHTIDVDDILCTDVNAIKGIQAGDYALVSSSELVWDVEHMAIANLHLGRLKDAIADLLSCLAQRFDVVIVDCPPGKAQSAERAIQAADLILCPTVPDRVSVWGIHSFSRYMKTMTDGRDINTQLVVTKFNANNKEHKRFCAALADAPPDNIAVLSDPDSDRANTPLVINQDVKLPRRLEYTKSSSFDGFYGKSGGRDIIRLARAVTAQLDHVERKAGREAVEDVLA